MRRIACLLLAALVALPGAAAFVRGETAASRRMVPYEAYKLPDIGKGEWASDAPNVAAVEGRTVTALAPGEALLIRTAKGKETASLLVTVEEDPAPPAEILRAIDAAIAEWEEAAGKSMKRSNKYTTWYYGPKASFGWCGAFAVYALAQGGVALAPTDSYKGLKPLADGSPYGVREAGVPKLLVGFGNLDRLTNVPRPGYLVVYGERGGYGALHVGLVTRVQALGDGTFLLETAEGNLASRVKRLSYVYDSRAGERQRNISMVGADMQTGPDVFQYRLTDESWRVTAFLQTWY